ncbi:MAG: tetratricopeptide repeat protein, partial [Candidatus Dadabacteria bacterium]|nr:tetratricopeptide repeat protein [Candidatus Dadabacteria bacterium]
KAQLLEREGKVAEAIDAYLRVGHLKRDPAVYDKALQLNPNNMTAIEKYLELMPDDVKMLERKAEILEKTFQKDEALDTYRKLVELKPDVAKYRDRVSALSPEPEPAPEPVKAVEYEMTPPEPESAAPEPEPVTEPEPVPEPEPTAEPAQEPEKEMSVDELTEKGNDYFASERFEDALACFDKVLIVNPNDQDMLHNKAAVLYKLKLYGEAIEVFNKLIQLDANDVAAYLTKGASYYWLGKYAEAIDSLNNVVKRDSNEASAWYYKACAEAKRGNAKLIVPFLTRAITLEPEFKDRAKEEEAFAALVNDGAFKNIVG